LQQSGNAAAPGRRERVVVGIAFDRCGGCIVVAWALRAAIDRDRIAGHEELQSEWLLPNAAYYALNQIHISRPDFVKAILFPPAVRWRNWFRRCLRLVHGERIQPSAARGASLVRTRVATACQRTHRPLHSAPEGFIATMLRFSNCAGLLPGL
jgi:hypothetical protein